jgi:large subunit ribosomal protein L30
MSKVKVTQIKSIIDRPRNQKLIIKALGLGKINRSVEKELNPAMSGMIAKVAHLVKIENI